MEIGNDDLNWILAWVIGQRFALLSLVLPNLLRPQLIIYRASIPFNQFSTKGGQVFAAIFPGRNP